MCSKDGIQYRCRKCAANSLIQLSKLPKGFTKHQGFLKLVPPLSAEKLLCLAALRRWGAPEFVGSEEGTAVMVKRKRGRPKKNGFD